MCSFKGSKASQVSVSSKKSGKKSGGVVANGRPTQKIPTHRKECFWIKVNASVGFIITKKLVSLSVNYKAKESFWAEIPMFLLWSLSAVDSLIFIMITICSLNWWWWFLLWSDQLWSVWILSKPTRSDRPRRPTPHLQRSGCRRLKVAEVVSVHLSSSSESAASCCFIRPANYCSETEVTATPR